MSFPSTEKRVECKEIGGQSSSLVLVVSPNIEDASNVRKSGCSGSLVALILLSFSSARSLSSSLRMGE